MARKRNIKKATALLGEPVDDAVVVAYRPPWAFLIVPVGMVPWLFLHSWAVLIIGGFVAGLLISLAGEAKFIARTPTRLVLLDSSRFFLLQPTKVDRDVAPDEIRTVHKPGMSRVISIEGRQYMLSRFFVDRLEAILGRTL